MFRVLIVVLILSINALPSEYHAANTANRIHTHTNLAAIADVLIPGQPQENAAPCNEGHKDGQCVLITGVPPKDGLDKTYIGVSIGLFIVGIGGLAAAFATFRSVKTSSERQLRAYVMVEGMDLFDGSNLNPVQEHRINVPGVNFAFKNSGQTPAYSVSSWWNLTVIPMQDEAHALGMGALKRTDSITLGRDGSFFHTRWFDRTLTAEEIRDIHNGARAIYVYGRIEYADIFKKRHYTNFRFYYSSSLYPPSTSGQFRYADTGNDAT